MSAAEIRVYFNPACSKCRQARTLLDERGASYRLLPYLDEAPSRDDLEEILALLGTDDPRAIIRTGEALYGELGLGGADRDRLLDAVASHPRRLERPIVITGDQAVVARPPEKLLELL